jgi:hypothetical protein
MDQGYVDRAVPLSNGAVYVSEMSNGIWYVRGDRALVDHPTHDWHASRRGSGVIVGPRAGLTVSEQMREAVMMHVLRLGRSIVPPAGKRFPEGAATRQVCTTSRANLISAANAAAKTSEAGQLRAVSPVTLFARYAFCAS